MFYLDTLFYYSKGLQTGAAVYKKTQIVAIVTFAEAPGCGQGRLSLVHLKGQEGTYWFCLRVNMMCMAHGAWRMTLP